MNTAITFAALWPVLFVAHQIADHWVQSSYQAARKGDRGWAGSRQCAAHVANYTVCTAFAVLIAWRLFHLDVSWLGFVLGQGISAVTHYWADRRWTLAWLARVRGNAQFYRLGVPREGHDDLPTLGTGAYALDQSWHYLWLGVVAALTAIVGA